MGTAAGDEETLFEVSGDSVNLTFRSPTDGLQWHASNGLSCDEELNGNALQWNDGSRWERELDGAANASRSDKLNGDSEIPSLVALGPKVVSGFRKAALALLDITEDSQGSADDAPVAGGGRRWPARLVPLLQDEDRHVGGRGPQRYHQRVVAPLDLSGAATALARFSASLGESEMESDRSGDDASAFDEEDSDPDDDLPASISQEGVDEPWMWRLARQEEWSPRSRRNLTFVESAIAFPRSATCVDCEQDGVPFSKSQLAKHPDERRCRDCAAKTQTDAANASAKKHKRQIPEVPAQMLASPATIAAPSVPCVVQCCACGVQLTKENMSNSQRQKDKARRRCLTCINTGNVPPSWLTEASETKVDEAPAEAQR